MLRDTSAINWFAGRDCAYLPDDQTLIVYNDDGTNNGTYTYKLISDKYIEVAQVLSDVNAPSPKPDYVVCVDITTVQNLPSKYDFLSPFLYTMAIVSAILIFFAAYRLILYPFFRKRG